MRWRHWILIATSTLAAMLGVGEVAAQTETATTVPAGWPERAGRLADVQGTVWVTDPEAAEWRAAERNRPLAEGDRLWVDAGGRADLRFGPTALLLSGGTELQLTRLDAGQLQFELIRGAVALRVLTDSHARQTLVFTREGQFEPLRAGHYRFDREGDVTSGAVWRGALMYRGPENLLQIDAGQRYAIRLDERGYARSEARGWPNDPLAAWAVEADRASLPTQAYRYVSPDITGVEDLDRYGGWDSHPEYGAVWIPYRVNPGWAPYQDGRWVWVRPWGWTWVDTAPWGFAPFHYGRWLQWRGRWCWWPGPRGTRPVFSPALVGWVGGANLSLSLAIGGPPHGSWAPLGPRQRYVPIVQPPRRQIHPPHQLPPREPRPRPPRQVRPDPVDHGAQGRPRGERSSPDRRGPPGRDALPPERDAGRRPPRERGPDAAVPGAGAPTWRPRGGRSSERATAPEVGPRPEAPPTTSSRRRDAPSQPRLVDSKRDDARRGTAKDVEESLRRLQEH